MSEARTSSAAGPNAAGGPTTYAELDALLADLLAGVRTILGPRLVGLYLGGSLAAGDFDPARSDVDFVAATEGRLSCADCASLAAMHRRLAGRHSWAVRLEGSYIPRDALRRYDPRRHGLSGVADGRRIRPGRPRHRLGDPAPRPAGARRGTGRPPTP